MVSFFSLSWTQKGQEPSRAELKIIQLVLWLEPTPLGLISKLNSNSKSKFQSLIWGYAKHAVGTYQLTQKSQVSCREIRLSRIYWLNKTNQCHNAEPLECNGTLGLVPYFCRYIECRKCHFVFKLIYFFGSKYLNRLKL